MTHGGERNGPALRWGLIGASDIAAVRGIPAIRATGGEVVVVRSASVGHAEMYAQRHGIPVAETDLLAAVGRTDIDAVYVSSINQQHHEHVLAAAAAGKHVLAEKPLALNLAHAKAMVAACREAGVVMATNHHLPASPTHRAMKQLVRMGALGEVRAIHMNHAVHMKSHQAGWRIGDREGGGAVLDLTVHDAAAITAILGTTAVSVSAFAARQDNDPLGAEDAVMTASLWGGNVLVQTHDAYNNPHAQTSVHILGTQGALTADNCNLMDPVGTVTLWHDGVPEPIDVGRRDDLYETTVRSFSAAVRGEGDVLVSGDDGVESLAVALAVLQSLHSGTRVTVER